MKQLVAGTTTEYNLNSTALPGVAIRLNLTSLNYTESGVAHYVMIHIVVGAVAKPLNGSGNLTITPQTGPSALGAKPLISHVRTVPITTVRHYYDTDPIMLTAVDDTLELHIYSDNANDADVTVVATVMEVIISDTNGRHNVSLVLGATPMSTANVTTSCTASLTTAELDRLVQLACAGNVITGNVVDNSIIALMLTKGGDISDYVGSTDSAEAIYDKLVAMFSATTLANLKSFMDKH